MVELPHVAGPAIGQKSLFDRLGNDRLAGGRLKLVVFEKPSVQDKFLLYSWPGNVRELYHAVIKYLSLGEMDFMRQSLAKSSSQPAGTAVQSTAEPGQPDNFQDYERSLLLAALNAAHWDTQAAAQALGLSRRSIQRKIKLYKLR